MKLETDDLYLAAYLLAEGGTLDSLSMKDKGSMVFGIEGDGLGRLEADYLRGTATANVSRFKASINHLKDLLFARIRLERRRDGSYERRYRECKEIA